VLRRCRIWTQEEDVRIEDWLPLKGKWLHYLVLGALLAPLVALALVLLLQAVLMVMLSFWPD
jgi:hypothetical protein